MNTARKYILNKDRANKEKAEWKSPHKEGLQIHGIKGVSYCCSYNNNQTEYKGKFVIDPEAPNAFNIHNRVVI